MLHRYNSAEPAARATAVLVVEDDPQLRELYRTALIGSGYAVVAVEDGVDALRYLERDTPAVMVLDLGLPRLNGRDVQREMAAHGLTERIPVIVVTGETTNIDERDYSCVLRKPIDPDALASAVQECLRQHRQRSS
jgi:DNA-binding response OmpR family regulator